MTQEVRLKEQGPEVLRDQRQPDKILQTNAEQMPIPTSEEDLGPPLNPYQQQTEPSTEPGGHEVKFKEDLKGIFLTPEQFQLLMQKE